MTKKMCQESFLNYINEPLKIEICKFIYDGYKERKALKMNAFDFANLKGISQSTVKKIELGKCYDLKMIDKYARDK